MQTWYPPAPAALPAAGPGPVAYTKRSAGLGLGADCSAAGSGCASSCMYRGWYQGTLRRPGLATAICTTTDTSRCRKTATGTGRPVQLGLPGLATGVQLDVVDSARAATMHAKSFGTLLVLHFLGGDDAHCNMASGPLPGRES